MRSPGNPLSCHTLACWHALWSTHSPIGTIRPGLFREGDEVRRRDQFVAVVSPAEQRLGADDGATG